MRHIAIVSLAAASLLPAQDWPMFRGPAGDGTAPVQTAPVSWTRERNVKWKTALALPANGSPIVVRGRVLLTTPEDPEGKRRSLYCYDRDTGAQRWVRTVDFGRVMPTHRSNPYGGTTPASDGERVVVWHGSAGLHCYDLDGEPLWHRDLGEFRHQWGYGTSPVIHAGKVILHTGPGARSFVIAVDIATGETVWRTDEPAHLTAAELEKKRLSGSWCTPLIQRVGDRTLAICAQPTRVVAYDVADGSIVWHCGGLRSQRGDLTYSSPTVGDGVCLIVGGYRGPTLGVAIDGEGDVTQTHRRWHNAEQMSNCASGVFADGHFFIPDMGCFLHCIEAQTGATRWRRRLGRGESWGSIIAAAGRLYVTIQDGTTVAFEPTAEELRVVSTNPLGETTNATPAFSDGEIFLRTHRHLYCIAAAE